MSTYAGNSGAQMSLSRQEQSFSGKSTSEVVDEFSKRWKLVDQQVKTLLEDADETIGENAYPIVPQTIVGIVANVFGFTPRAGLADSELHSKWEALPGKSMINELSPTTR